METSKRITSKKRMNRKHDNSESSGSSRISKEEEESSSESSDNNGNKTSSNQRMSYRNQQQQRSNGGGKREGESRKYTDSSSEDDDDDKEDRSEHLKEEDNDDDNDDDDDSTDDDDDEESLGFVYTTKFPWQRNLMDTVQSLRYRCGMVINRPSIQLVLVVLICINAVTMGISTFPVIKDDPENSAAFEKVDRVFLYIFTMELVMQGIYHGWRLLIDGWLVFDLVVILTSWLFDGIQVIRAFRIFRALRLVTRIKVMKNLVVALFSVIPRMIAIGLLLFLVSYIFAVMFTMLFKDMYENEQTDENYFGRLDASFLTLFQIMTLDQWANISRQVTKVYSWAWLPFVTYVIVAGFVVANLIIAVICDAISSLHDEERAKLTGFELDDDESDDNNAQQGETEVHPAWDEDVRDQLDSLEDHVAELNRSHDELLTIMHVLVKSLQEQRAMLEEVKEQYCT